MGAGREERPVLDPNVVSNHSDYDPELPFNPGPVTDEEIGEAGKALFGFLDQEETAARAR